jgi:hypothetical protein
LLILSYYAVKKQRKKKLCKKMSLISIIIKALVIISFGEAAKELAVQFSIAIDGYELGLKVPVESPPFATATQLCAQYQLVPPSHQLLDENSCEIVVANEINRVQSAEMAKHGSGGIGVHKGEYFLKSNLLERELRLNNISFEEWYDYSHLYFFFLKIKSHS